MLRRQGDSLRVPAPGDSTQKVLVDDLKHHLQDWYTDAKIKGHTVQSTQSRQARIGKFFWFLDFKGYSEVGTRELKDFFLYIQTAHETPEGRWGNPNLRTPMQQVSVCNYHRIVKAFFRFLIEEELIDFDPMLRVKVAKEKTEIKPPISNEDFKRLLDAAK